MDKRTEKENANSSTLHLHTIAIAPGTYRPWLREGNGPKPQDFM